MKIYHAIHPRTNIKIRYWFDEDKPAYCCDILSKPDESGNRHVIDFVDGSIGSSRLRFHDLIVKYDLSKIINQDHMMELSLDVPFGYADEN